MRRWLLNLGFVSFLLSCHQDVKEPLSFSQISCPLYNPDVVKDEHGAFIRPFEVGSIVSNNPPIRVHYCHSALKQLAKRVAQRAAYSYRIQVNKLGFSTPLSDGNRGGGPELDLYLVNLGRAGKAQANEEPSSEHALTEPGYVVIDYRTTEDRDFLASYVAHEMNHVLQYAVGRFASPAFMEAVAAYVDDYVYPSAHILPSMVTDFQYHPYRTLWYYDDVALYHYGAALFTSYLIHRYNLNVIHSTLKKSHPDYFESLDSVLREKGIDTREVLRDFVYWRTRTGRYHSDKFFGPRAWQLPEVTADRQISVYEFLDKPLEILPQHPPQPTGTTYFTIDLNTILPNGLTATVKSNETDGKLWFSIFTSESNGFLAQVGIEAGAGKILSVPSHQLPPGVRIWLAVTNEGKASDKTHSFTLKFHPIL